MNISNIGKKIANAININSPVQEKPSNHSSKPNFEGTLSNGLEILGAQNKAFIKHTPKYSPKVQEQIDYLESITNGTKQEKVTLKNGEQINLKVFKGTKRGSNEGYYAANENAGELYYVKIGDEQSQREVLASKIYKEANLDVPEMEVIKFKNGKTGLISKYIPNLTPIFFAEKNTYEAFAMDTFLANWDSVCSCNAQTDGKKSYRLDFGGALDYRAQGGKKPAFYNPVVNELTTMLDYNMNGQSANMFSNMNREDLINSIKKVVDLDEKKLKDLVFEYAPKDGDKIYNTLLGRKKYLSNILHYVENTPMGNQNMLEYMQCAKNFVALIM